MTEQKKTYKLVIFLTFVLTTIIGIFITPTVHASASNVTYQLVDRYQSVWHSPQKTDIGIFLITADNKPVFCIEKNILLHGGEFNPSKLSIAQQEKLSLIAYYGYHKNPSNINYGITQNMIWETLGEHLVSTEIPNYANRKTEILAQVAQYNIKPSFNAKSIVLNVGDSITLTDDKNVLKNYQHLLSNSANLAIEKNGNQLKLTATKNSKKSGNLQYARENERIGTSILYSRPGDQKVVDFMLENGGLFNLNIKVKPLGHVKIRKIDETTNLPMPNVKLKIEYDGISKELLTNEHGVVEIHDLKADTKEVLAPHGYFNKGETKETIIKSDKTVEVVMNNKPQMGVVSLKKTGQKPVSIEKKKSKYGVYNQFVFNQKPLANVSYDIQAMENIKVGNTVRAKKGDIVATVKTNDKGELTSPQLFLGKYQMVEKVAPNGFIIDKQPIPFEFKYEGQLIELASTSLLKATNHFQKVQIEVHKKNEVIKHWKNNKPILGQVDANKKVFGLFTKEEITLDSQIKIPAKTLISYAETRNGIANFNTQLPQAKFYIKELEAGKNHVLDQKEHDFEFTAKDNGKKQIIGIWKNQVAYGKENLLRITREPILNKVHFNEFNFKKINETAKISKKMGYKYQYNGNAKGAVFELSNKQNEVIQTITINKDSIGTIKNIPVGVFFLTEKSPSTDQYMLPKGPVKLVSSKKSVIAYDEYNNVISTKTTSEHAPLFKLNNKLIKGSVELTKKEVSNGELLPDTGVQILDANKEIVAKGRTDHDGKFTFHRLPKGMYYFKEFDAPRGYKIDETPIPFEIKTNSEIVKCEMTNKKEEVRGMLPSTGENSGKLLTIAGGILVLASSVSFLIYRKKKQQNND